MPDLRAQIDHLIASGSAVAASARLAELWRKESGPAAAAFLASRFEQLRGKLPLPSYRVAFLRSFTIEPATTLLRVMAFLSGIDLTVQVGDFNAYAQEILDGGSSLYGFAPDAVILAVRTADVAPELWQSFATLSADEAEQATVRTSSSFTQWIRAFRRRSQAALVTLR